MPNVVIGAGAGPADLTVTNHGYTYPNNLDLRPSSTLHTKIVQEVTNRARVSYNEMKNRHKNWRDIDRNLTAFVELDDAESLIKDADKRKPVRIVVPYSYATLETLLAYFSSAFLSDDTLLRYEGVGPEDILPALMLERVIATHTYRNKIALALHTLFRDGFVYGFGVGAPYWDVIHGKKIRRQEGTWYSDIIRKWMGGPSKDIVDAVLFEGNNMSVVDPYCVLPDPTVPIHECQKGEFWGWVDRTNYNAMLSEEKTSQGSMFNVRYLNSLHSMKTSIVETDASGRNDRFGTSLRTDNTVNKPADRIYMYVNLIPKDWGLSTSEYPEKWMFCVAGDAVVVEARQLGLIHNMYPIVTNCPDFDGHSVSPISRLEIIQGLQETLDWLFTSHIANVRKAINDMLIVDPSLINMNDLKHPGPGRLVRLRKHAWGRGVDQAVKQLAVSDVTKQHIGDSSYVIDLIQRVTSATDSLQGLMRTGGERVTAQEYSGVRGGALSRLAKSAMITSMQVMRDLGYMFASHTQQFMSEEVYIRTVGDWEREFIDEYGIELPPAENNRIRIRPNDILADYDVITTDGSVMNPDDANTWVNLFSVLSKNEALMQRFDMARVFKHIARKMGAKNVDKFEVRTAPDASVSKEAQAGNVVSTGDMLSQMGGGNV